MVENIHNMPPIATTKEMFDSMNGALISMQCVPLISLAVDPAGTTQMTFNPTIEKRVLAATLLEVAANLIQQNISELPPPKIQAPNPKGKIITS